MRSPHDFYETPAWCVRAILPHLPACGEAFDPCAGEGAILDVLKPELADATAGYEIDPERAARAGVKHGDALELPWRNPMLVVMNPPFSLAEEFVYRALAEVHPRGTVAALLRLGFLASKKRSQFHQARPADVYVLPRRPSFTANGKTDSSEYAWFCWGPGRGGRWQVLEVDDES